MCNYQINLVFLIEFLYFWIKKVLIFSKVQFSSIIFFYIGISRSKHASKYCFTSWASFKGQNSHSKAFTHYEVECKQTGKYRVFQIITHFDAMFYLITTLILFYKQRFISNTKYEKTSWTVACKTTWVRYTFRTTC